ncbi:hypothetical protein [Oceanidesulfovibrio marinus]|uniref:Uncharacterized protein n=1 Tax=Oceanidesulfovibrio marinus TaxID=370038 RepID=A0A6P1ZLX4_9BACT|nr:hypothetical protein [Oceanidesulfovibrio marinus]TVM36510.1 hypothetical protein DQK91_00865 [Oceanidesulfovibrio marinus]
MRITIFLSVLVMLAALLAAGCSDEDKKPAEEYTTKSETEYYADQPNGTDTTQENASEPMKQEVTPVKPGMTGEQNMSEGNMTEGGMMHEGNMTEGGEMMGNDGGGMMHEEQGGQSGAGGQNSSNTTTDI